MTAKDVTMKPLSLPAKPPFLFSDYTNLAVFLLVLGLCSFIYTAARGLQSIEQIDSHNDASRQALQNSILITETLSLLKDIETGQRGFIITGDESFLVPYKIAKARFDETYKNLTDNLSEANNDKFEHAHLDRLVQQRIRQAEFLINERRDKGASMLHDPTLYQEGKQLMDEIRVEVGVLHKAQMNLSSSRIEQAQDVQMRSLNLNFWLSVWGTLLLFVSAVFLIREKRIRDIAQQTLKNANIMLERTVTERTQQLQNALDRIKKFALELDQSVELERRRLAREVHDQLGQIFTSLKLVMMGLKNASTETCATKAEDVSQLLDEGINVARRISSELRPPLLDDFGLAAAIEHYAKVFSGRGGPQMTVDVGHDRSLSAQQANQLFRILQEASINVLRHAEANCIIVEGKFTKGMYEFCVTDDGIGPQPIRKDASGVRNMRERAAMVGGSFHFGPAEPRGTRITVLIPLQFEENE
jgi:signal transduction histidine kinase